MKMRCSSPILSAHFNSFMNNFNLIRVMMTKKQNKCRRLTYTEIKFKINQILQSTISAIAVEAIAIVMHTQPHAQCFLITKYINVN